MLCCETVNNASLPSLQERETTELKSKLSKLKEDFQYNLKVRGTLVALRCA